MRVYEYVGVCGQACVKPLQVMLAKAAYSFIFDAMKNSTVEEEEAEVSVLDSPEVHAACGLAILDALQTRGVLIQRALHGNSEPNKYVQFDGALGPAIWSLVICLFAVSITAEDMFPLNSDLFNM